MQKNDHALLERFRLQAEEWVDLDAAARLREENKTATLAQMINEFGDMAHNRAERTVKASTTWAEYIAEMVEARRAANLARVRMDYLRMRLKQQESANYAARAEAHLTR